VKIEKHKDASLPLLPGKRVALIVARFYDDLADMLESGARHGLAACGVHDAQIECFAVPGCFEIPLAAKSALERGFDAAVALGVVIRGHTPHFEYVAGECAHGIMEVQLAAGKPIGFGILTCETRAQAEERSDPYRGNKGYDAAVAAMQVLALTQPA